MLRPASLIAQSDRVFRRARLGYTCGSRLMITTQVAPQPARTSTPGRSQQPASPCPTQLETRHRSRLSFSAKIRRALAQCASPRSLITLESIEALIPLRDSSGSHCRPGAWVATRKPWPRHTLRPRSDEMPQPSHHTTPACARAPPLARTRVSPSGRTPYGCEWRATKHHSQRNIH
jgi:hypothetical protein